MKKSFWLSYDLGIKGDYESLYYWLADLGAKECGDSLAYLKLDIQADEKPKEVITREVTKHIQLKRKDRIYVIWKEGTKIKGSFICGARKAPPWADYATFTSTEDESD